jgi:hypothetical protein
MKKLLVALMLFFPLSASAETPDEWISLGARVHGGFGALVAVGIKIGQDAMKRFNAGPGDLKVVYHDSDKSPGRLCCGRHRDRHLLISRAAEPGHLS